MNITKESVTVRELCENYRDDFIKRNINLNIH